MQTRTQRGRAVRAKSTNPLRTFYIILAVLAVVGVAVLATVLLPRQAQPKAAVDVSDLNTFPSKGNASAPVTVVEYADFQCPGCAAFATQLEPEITRKYIDTGKVRFIFHEMPLTQHRNAIPSAEAARCAADQGKFWQMHDILFANQQQWQDLANPTPQFTVYAQQLGLDKAAFEQCLTGGTHRATIQAAQKAAFNAQIPATPTFVINGKQYEALQLEDAIKAALGEK